MPAMYFAIASGLCYNKTIHTEKGESPHAQYHRDHGFSRAGAGPYARLTQNQLRSRLEPEKGIFIAESPKVISRALDAGFVPVSC